MDYLNKTQDLRYFDKEKFYYDRTASKYFFKDEKDLG